MPQLTSYFLHFHSGLHRGTSGVSLEDSGVDVPSDTLFAALTAAWRTAGGDVAAWCAAFAADPPLLLTSAFPFAGAVRFFPLPVAWHRLVSPATLRQRAADNALKNVRFLSESLLCAVLGGQQLDDRLFPADELQEPGPAAHGVALQGGALWLTRDEARQLPAALAIADDKLFALRRRAVWDDHRLPRVTLDRVTSASTYFQIGRTAFAPGSGLWFGVHWRDPQRPVGAATVRTAFEQALAHLQDAGLGGERTAGYGGFQLKEGPGLNLPDAAPGQPAMLLSRYHPTGDDIAAGTLDPPFVAYRLDSVGGYLQSPDSAAQLRRRVRMIAAGSLVNLPRAICGDLADVRPNHPDIAFPHPVYRYGYALAAGWQENANG